MWQKQLRKGRFDLVTVSQRPVHDRLAPHMWAELMSAGTYDGDSCRVHITPDRRQSWKSQHFLVFTFYFFYPTGPNPFRASQSSLIKPLQMCPKLGLKFLHASEDQPLHLSVKAMSPPSWNSLSFLSESLAACCMAFGLSFRMPPSLDHNHHRTCFWLWFWFCFNVCFHDRTPIPGSICLTVSTQ